MGSTSSTPSPVHGVAVVGCGRIARKWHLPAWSARTDAKLLWTVDVDAAAAAEAALAWSANGSTMNLAEVLDDPEVTVVDVCTPPEAHAEQVRAILAAGRHVLVEKPAATTAAEVKGLAEAARAAGTVAMVGENWLHSPAIDRLRGLLDAGTLGRPLSITATLETGIDLTCHPDTRRSRLINGGVHMLNLIRHLCGEPTRLSAFALPGGAMAATGPQADTDVVVAFGFGDTAIGSLQLSGRAHRARPGVREVRLIGTAGMAAADPIAGWVEWSTDAWDGGVRYRWSDHSGEVGQRRQIAHFLAAVNGETTALPSLDDQWRTHRLIEAIQRSARDLTTVEVSR